MRRNPIGLAFWGLLFTASASFAMWRALPLEEVAMRSELVVVATLANVKEWTHDGMDYGVGRLVVEDVICGDATVGDSLVLKWENRSTTACPRVEHRPAAGRSLIWFLEPKPDGTVRADHPNRKHPIDELEEVRAVLKNYPVVIRLKHGWNPGEPVTARIIFRNTTDSLLAIPGVGCSSGVLERDPRVRLDMITWNSERRDSVQTREGRSCVRPDMPPIQLAPGETKRVELILTDLFETAGAAAYRFSFRLRPDDRVVNHFFSIYTPQQARLETARQKGQLIAFLIAVLEGREEYDLRQALMLLHWEGKRARDAVPAVQARYEDADTDTRMELIRVLSWVDPDPDRRLAFFLPLVSDPEPRIRGAALHALRTTSVSAARDEIKRDEFFATILLLMDDVDAQTRINAICSLWGCRYAPDDVVMKLDLMAEWDPDEQVRRSAHGVWRHFVE